MQYFIIFSRVLSSFFYSCFRKYSFVANFIALFLALFCCDDSILYSLIGDISNGEVTLEYIFLHLYYIALSHRAVTMYEDIFFANDEFRILNDLFLILYVIFFSNEAYLCLPIIERKYRIFASIYAVFLFYRCVNFESRVGTIFYLHDRKVYLLDIVSYCCDHIGDNMYFHERSVLSNYIHESKMITKTQEAKILDMIKYIDNDSDRFLLERLIHK